MAPGTLALAREAGYSAACATVRGQVVRGADPLWLPRHVPGDVEGEELVRRLNGFFDDFAMPHPPRGGAAQRARPEAERQGAHVTATLPLTARGACGAPLVGRLRPDAARSTRGAFPG